MSSRHVITMQGGVPGQPRHRPCRHTCQASGNSPPSAEPDVEAFQGETAPAPSTAALNGSSSHSEVVNGEAGSDAATENGASQSNGAGQRKSNMNGSYSMDGGSPDGPDGDLSQPMASNDNDAPASAVHTVERHLKEVQESDSDEEGPASTSSVDHEFNAKSRSLGTMSQDDGDEAFPRPASFWLPHPDAPDANAATVPSSEGFYPAVSARLTDIRRTMMRAPKVLSSWVTYRVQQLMLSNTIVKIFMVFLFAMPAVIVGGELYSVITGEPQWEGLLKVYSVLYIIPGINLLSENNALAGVLLNAIFLLGTFSFAVILGVVSDDISSEVKAIRSGNYPVLASGHILVLNWNRQTIPLLRQLALVQREQSGVMQRRSVFKRSKVDAVDGSFLADRPVVIMAERDKEWMDGEVQGALKGYKVNWQTRQGAPYSAADLAKVSAGNADTIILLRPEHGVVVEATADDTPADKKRKFHQAVAQREVAALLGINAGRDPAAAQDNSRRQNVIVQAPEDGTDVVTSAKRLLTSPGLNALGLKDRRDITRLVAQSALQPGVASVHASILQKSVNSTSFYLRHFPQFEGMSYGEVRRCFATALVVGLFSGADNCPRLNPKDTEILTKDDKVVLLSNTSSIWPAEGMAKEYSSFLEYDHDSGQNSDEKPRPKHIVVAGWCGDIFDLVHSLTLFAPRSSHTVVTVLCGCCPDNFPQNEEHEHIEFRYMCGEVEHSGALEEAGVPEADAIIIGPAENLPDGVSDANMLSLMVMLQDLLIMYRRHRSNPCHVVGVVRCPQTVKVANYTVRDLAQGTMTAELLQPDELVSGLIAQVTSEPALAPLLSELIHSMEGVEVNLRDPIDYDLNDLRPTTFAVVSEFARRRRETAIGYVTRQGVIVLAPTAADTHLFRNTDHIVVLSKDDH